MKEKFKLLTSKGFTAGLVLLLLNDFILKAAFHNNFTGKLSDVAGLFIFPLFWFSFFPKHKKNIFFLTGLLFIYWKSPFSQPLIDGWNALNVFSIQRVVDYSDLVTLLILPLSFYYSSVEIKKPVFAVHPVFPVLIAAFSFIATSKYDRSRLGYYDVDYPFYSDPVKYGSEISVEMPAYTFVMRPAEIFALMNKYNFEYIDKISADSLLFLKAFNGFDRKSPLVKVSNTHSGNKSMMRIESVIFDTSALNKPNNKWNDHYKTENATLFANEFAGWFIPKFVAVKSTDSLHAIGMTIAKTYPDSAIAIYSKAIKIAPPWMNSQLLLNYWKGFALYNKQQYHEALRYYYRADSINLKYGRRVAAPYFGLADTYKKLDQKDSAKKYRKLARDTYAP